MVSREVGVKERDDDLATFSGVTTGTLWPPILDQLVIKFVNNKRQCSV